MKLTGENTFSGTVSTRSEPKATINVENGIELIAEDIVINYLKDTIEVTNGHFMLKIPRTIWEEWQFKSDTKY